MDGFLNPQEIIKKLNLRQNMTVADFGCGAGGWAIPIAKILEKGKVYAIDVLEEPLSALEGRAQLSGLQNIERVLGDVEKGVKIPDESLDLVLMTNLLFEVENIKRVLSEGKRVLKNGGRILVVDWRKESSVGPDKRVDRKEVEEIATSLGLKIVEEFDAGNYHWGLILEK